MYSFGIAREAYAMVYLTTNLVRDPAASGRGTCEASGIVGRDRSWRSFWPRTGSTRTIQTKNWCSCNPSSCPYCRAYFGPWNKMPDSANDNSEMGPAPREFAGYCVQSALIVQLRPQVRNATGHKHAGIHTAEP